MVLSDQAVIIGLQAVLAPLHLILVIASALGDEAVLAAIVVGVYAAGKRRVALTLAGSLLLSAGLNLFLKSSLGFPRPPTELHQVSVSSSSLPSGHAQLSATFWASLRVKVRHPAVLPTGAVVVAIVCISRLYLGVHYLGDVLAGVAVGIAAAAVWTMLEPRVRRELADVRNAHLSGWAGAVLVVVGGIVAVNPISPSHGTLPFVLAGLAFAHSLETDLAPKSSAGADWQVRLALSLSLSMPLVFIAEFLPPIAGSVPAVFAGLIGATAAPRIAAKIGA